MSNKEQKCTSTKSNNLIDAGFFKKLNGFEMRVFNLAVSRLNPTRPLDQNRRFEFTVKEFLSANTGILDKNNAYENVKEAIKNLSRVWVPVKPLEGYSHSEVSLLIRRDYTENQGRFMIEFHEDVMPYLAEIKNNYTSILLETFGTLKSEYSLKFYEILSRWAFKGKFHIKLEELRDLLNVGDSYNRYNNLNQWVIKPAIKEINIKTNLNVTVKTIRTGRSITELEFTILDKSKAIDVKVSRPKFPHKNKYGKFVKLNRQDPKMSSAEYGNYARDCLKILEDFYSNIDDVSKEDLLYYWIFLAVNQSNKSKLGTKKTFVDELKQRGYKIVDCELVKLEK